MAKKLTDKLEQLKAKKRRRVAVFEAASAQLADPERWSDGTPKKSAKQRRLDRHAAEMRAARIVRGLKTGGRLPRVLRDAIEKAAK